MTTVSVRSATRDDIPAILALERQSSGVAHWTSEQYASRIEDGLQNGSFLVAESDNKICGFVCAHTVTGEWEIENIVVGEKFRRHGIATQLMRSLINRWEHALGTALLLEVRQSNTAARALYAEFGLQAVGRRPGYYREPVEDAILYALHRT